MENVVGEKSGALQPRELFPPGWKPGSTAGRDARRYIRFAPPMCITDADADFIVEVFDAAFEKLA